MAETPSAVANDRRSALSTDRPDTSRSASSPASPTIVVFLLSVEGHMRSLGARAPARSFHRLSLSYVEHLQSDLAARGSTAKVEVREFDSLASLIQHRPKGRERWAGVVIITHGHVVATEGRDGVPEEGGRDEIRETSGIWLGDRAYVARGPDPESVISNALNDVSARQLSGFRAGFSPDSELMIVQCGLGKTHREVALFMRDLFATDGVVVIPTVSVDFDKKTGRLGALVEGDESRLRPLTAGDWMKVEARAP